jgi:hypothetical protein
MYFHLCIFQMKMDFSVLFNMIQRSITRTKKNFELNETQKKCEVCPQVNFLCTLSKYGKKKCINFIPYKVNPQNNLN